MKDFRKYFYVLLITCSIFVVAGSASNYFANRKLVQIRDIQDQVAVDILSSETQYSLLSELPCAEVDTTLLSHEIGELAERIDYAEQNVENLSELQLLKEQYTILEVKDFLLSKRIGERCGKPSVTILYFYGREEDCEDCVKQSYVLDAIRSTHPEVRVYSFDYNLDLSTIRALKSIYDIKTIVPALVINGKTLTGFQSVSAIETLLPKITK